MGTRLDESSQENRNPRYGVLPPVLGRVGENWTQWLQLMDVLGGNWVEWVKTKKKTVRTVCPWVYVV